MRLLWRRTGILCNAAQVNIHARVSTNEELRPEKEMVTSLHLADDCYFMIIMVLHRVLYTFSTRLRKMLWRIESRN